MGAEKWNASVLSRDEQREQKRRAVLLAGAKLFNEQGFDRTSLEDIAAALNITKRTIYYYVQSKEDILYGCNLLGMEFVRDLTRKCSDRSVPVMDRIALLIREYTLWLGTDLGVCLVKTDPSTLSGERQDELRKGRRKLDTKLRDLIREGREAGHIRNCNPRLAAAAIFGALNWIPYWNHADKPESHDRIYREFIDLFGSGLSA